MIRRPGIHRFSVALSVVFAMAGARGLAADEEKPAVVLSPEVEGKFAEFLKKGREAKRKVWTARMKSEIGRIAKVAPVGEAETKALEAAAEQAAEACIDGWTAKVDEGYRQYLGNYEDEDIDQMLTNVDQVAQSDWFGNYVRPFDHPKWEEAIRQTLGADQAEAWKKARTEHDEAVRKEAADLLKTIVEGSRQQQETALLAKAAAIKSLLGLSKERSEKLEALAKSVAEAGAAKFRPRAEELLLAMDDPERQRVLKTKQFYVGEEPKYIAAQHAAWLEGVTGVLSQEEAAKMKGAKETSAAPRIGVMGRLVLPLLDDRVAFTESQRQQLLPIAERLVKKQKTLMDDSERNGYFRINAQTICAAGSRAEEEELKAILDPTQRARWKEACLPGGRTGVRIVAGLAGRVVLGAKPAVESPKPPIPAAEPEDLENAFSDALHAQTLTQRKQLLATHLLKAEDAARVAGLPPEIRARLETAARGVTEALLATWKVSTEQNIRAQVQDATVENIRQRLASLGNYTYQTLNSAPSETPIWDQAVKAEMTEPQLAAWRKEMGLRNAYREKTIAALIVSELDRRVSLTPEQWEKLEPIIAGKAREYAPDIEGMFSSSYPYTWFLQSYTMFIPIVAVGEAEMKAILTTTQWDNWSSGPELENTNNYWENVKSRHDERTKEKKK